MRTSGLSSSRDYLSIVVALGKSLNTLLHPEEQLVAACETIIEISPELRKIYFTFSQEKEEGTEPGQIFSCDCASQALSLRRWKDLAQEEQGLFDEFFNQLEHKKGEQKRTGKKGLARPQKNVAITRRADREQGLSLESVLGTADGIPPVVRLKQLAYLPLNSSSEPQGWILFVGPGEGGAPWSDEEEKAVSVCADMLCASLDRARLFEKVLRAKKEWEQSVDAIRDVVMIIDPDFGVNRGNKQLARLAGVPVKVLKGKKCHRLLGSSRTSCRSCPAEVTRKTGEQATEEIVRPNGDAVFQVWSYPIYDTSGDLDSVVVYEKDVTEYKRMQQKLVHAERMGVLGQLAAAVAHELNNPLSGVISFSQILLREMDPGSSHLEDVKNIEHAAHRCKKIVEDLLAFARKPETKVGEPISLLEVIEQVVAILRPKLEEKGVQVEWEVPPDLSELPYHPDPLHQILVNLISNARDAMEDGGKVRIQARQEKVKGADCVVVAVKDTGPGIPRRQQDKIFEPFYTTKAPGDGTGLGLSICQRLMESFGGWIDVSSRIGKGTTFSLWFPIAGRK